jgi:hypothetical protein
MQQRQFIAHDHHDLAPASAQESPQDAVALAAAIALITARQYRPGEANLARYTARIQPLMPDADYIGRRGVDLIAFAGAIEKGLDVALFGQVIQYKAWPIDEFNRFMRANIGHDVINSAMQRFLDHPRNW